MGGGSKKFELPFFKHKRSLRIARPRYLSCWRHVQHFHAGGTRQANKPALCPATLCSSARIAAWRCIAASSPHGRWYRPLLPRSMKRSSLSDPHASTHGRSTRSAKDSDTSPHFKVSSASDERAANAWNSGRSSSSGWPVRCSHKLRSGAPDAALAAISGGRKAQLRAGGPLLVVKGKMGGKANALERRVAGACAQQERTRPRRVGDVIDRQGAERARCGDALAERRNRRHVLANAVSWHQRALVVYAQRRQGLTVGNEGTQNGKGARAQVARMQVQRCEAAAARAPADGGQHRRLRQRTAQGEGFEPARSGTQRVSKEKNARVHAWLIVAVAIACEHPKRVVLIFLRGLPGTPSPKTGTVSSSIPNGFARCGQALRSRITSITDRLFSDSTRSSVRCGDALHSASTSSSVVSCSSTGEEYLLHRTYVSSQPRSTSLLSLSFARALRHTKAVRDVPCSGGEHSDNSRSFQSSALSRKRRQAVQTQAAAARSARGRPRKNAQKQVRVI